MTSLLRVDLGCGKNKAAGCLGVDCCAGNGPDIVADCRFRIEQLRDGCAEYVTCRHMLEHLEGDGWRDVIREIERLLCSGGQFEIRVPHPSCEDAMIHGHQCVLTPLYWRNMQQGLIGMPSTLVIDRVEEMPVAAAVEYCLTHGHDFDEWARFHMNAYHETEIHGHRV